MRDNIIDFFVYCLRQAVDRLQGEMKWTSNHSGRLIIFNYARKETEVYFYLQISTHNITRKQAINGILLAFEGKRALKKVD